MTRTVPMPGPCGAGFLTTRQLRAQTRPYPMDPQTLPSEAKKIYDRIRDRYKVGFEPLRIGDIRLNLLKMTDLEQVLDGRDPLADVSAFPFWIRLWEAAIVLSEFVAAAPWARSGRVLELGAGLGAPGLTAAARGSRVTLSDYEELILDFQQVSAAASNLTGVETMMLDWLDPPEMQRFDTILGAEILFREEFFQPLLSIMDKTLTDDGRIFLAHDVRRQSLGPFLRLAEEKFVISAQKKKLKSLEQDREILLTRLVRR